jgi:hypothetical protein
MLMITTGIVRGWDGALMTDEDIGIYGISLHNGKVLEYTNEHSAFKIFGLTLITSPI